MFIGHVCVCFYRLYFDVTIYNNYIWWKTDIKIMIAAFMNVLESHDWQTTYSFTENRVLSWRFNANVDPAYELWKIVGTSCITDVRDITTASNFQEPEDEGRLSEMLAVRLHLNNTKPLKMYMANTSETWDILRISKRNCRPEKGSTLSRNSFVCDTFYREEGINTVENIWKL